jgi:zinc/manganese transport system substrate-binding protein
MPVTRLVAIAAAAVSAALAAGCSSTVTGGPSSTRPGVIVAVAAENQYANVISQIGGRYIQVSAIESNPNTDPHTFEATASVSELVSRAQLVVQNGLGYDSYLNTIEKAAPGSGRRVIVVQHLLGLPDGTPNPHLWYAPRTMPAVARAIATDLSALQPKHAGFFRARLAAFDASLRPWYAAIASFKAAHPGTPVAVTEPVGDYLLQALGTRILTPFGLQADVMNGVDLPPQYVTLETSLFQQHKVKALLYNQQVMDSATASFLAAARRNGIPVVGLYETMPRGHTYQSWMLAEVQALDQAVTRKVSAEKL